MQFQRLGPYRIGKKLGQGGMGAVYEAVDATSGEAAAVKVLTPALASEEGFRSRFEAEIESLKKLRHPNIVRLYGYGEQDGVLFYGMELVRGTSLEEELRAGRRFEWREVTQLTVKLCRALKHAHDAGVIHRDIKPANLMLTEDGDVKLSDFGIARLYGNVRMTNDGGLLGTAEYMSPEQAEGRRVTDRCDQYSLGGVMYALLAGRPPFRAASLVEMLQLQRFSEPDPVRRYAPNTPAELEGIISQLLAKDPDARFVNCTLLGRALEAMEHGLTLAATRGGSKIVIAPPDKPASAPTRHDGLAATIAPSDAEGVTKESEYELDVPQATEATRAYSEAVADQEQESEAQAKDSASRFTKVGEDKEAHRSWYSEMAASFGSLQTLGIVALLAILLAGVMYLMRRPSADQLYHDIQTLVSDGKTDEAQSKIDAFAQYYPDDSRTAELVAYRDHLDLGRPVERAYSDANRLVRLNPELAAARFQALIDVYGDSTADSQPAAHYVEQAKQQLRRLQKQLAEQIREDLRLLQIRLKRAEALSTTDPPAARKIWQGIIELYGEKHWAATVVAQARTLLAAAEETDSDGKSNSEVGSAEKP